ncbi:MAG: hypothetical protein ACOC2U_01780 [bacterium]
MKKGNLVKNKAKIIDNEDIWNESVKNSLVNREGDQKIQANVFWKNLGKKLGITIK